MTLSEINITPLLDLAFVLLIIFVITTPLLDNGIQLKLPKGGEPDQKIEKSDIRTVEISSDGYYFVNTHKTTLDLLESNLKKDRQLNPNLVVVIRADRRCQWEPVADIINLCQRDKLKMSVRFEPPGKR